MPYPGEHAARLKQPGQYKRIRRENDKFASGIHAIWGVKEDDTVELQAVRFDASKFTVAQARDWLKEHNYSPLEFEEASQEQQEAHWFEAAMTPIGEQPTGKEWEITIIGAKPDFSNVVVIEGKEYIKSSNGRLYSVDGLKNSVAAWDEAIVYDNHLTDEEFKKRQGMRSPFSEWLATLRHPHWNEKEKSLKATMKVVEDALAKKLLNAYQADAFGEVGLSIDVKPIIAKQEIAYEGQHWPIIEGIDEIISVDLVARPAAGGRFDRLIAANYQEQDEVTKMELTEEMKAFIMQAVKEAMATMMKDKMAEEAVTTPAPAETSPPEVTPEKEPEVKILECRIILNEVLAKTKLSEDGEALVRRTYEGKIFEATALGEFIKEVKKLEIKNDPTGRVTENGTQRQPAVQTGLSDKEKLEVEFYRLVMGNSAFRELEHKQEDFVAERVREGKAYKSWLNTGKPNTGNYRRLSELIRDFLGGDPFLDEIRLSEASTLASVTKNAMNIMIAADYSVQQRWYEAIVNVEEVDTIDQATLVRLFGVNTLDVVNKGAAYTELAQDDEEETAAFVKRGNIIAVPMEDLMTDKLQYFRTIPRRLSDTWYNTLSALTSAVFTVNSAAGPVLSDSGALFNATAVASAGGHANLLTTALSFTNFSTARIAMRKQTNRPLGAGRRLQINPAFLLVPDDLETTALQIRNSEYIPSSANNDVNPFYQKFEVIPVPDFTDANDWALVGDKVQFPAIWHIFPRGGRTPQLFTADDEAAGAMFTNDTIRFKCRMLTYRFSATYDCAPVGDWRALAKQNVT